MPLYEGRHNAENKIVVSEQTKKGLIFETPKVIAKIAQEVKKCVEIGKSVSLDGWYGVDFKRIASMLEVEMKQLGIKAKIISTNEIFKNHDEIKAYKQPYITDDPSFGYCNMVGEITDLFDTRKLNELQQKTENEAVVIFGYGAAVKELEKNIGVSFYFDKTRQPLLWELWDKKLIPFGAYEPQEDYDWKEYYYCDFFLLHFQKREMLEKMDYYVEGIDVEDLKLISKKAYDDIIKTTLQYPIKEVEIYQPGPWGAYRYKDFWDIKGLECNAWNELAGPELSILIDVGAEKMINMPFVNLMQYPKELVGETISSEYPELFPLDVWLDDGYFEKPQPAERISMPIHTHPSTDYVKKHFNEPIGRYETYYIAEAYEGANTWMGFPEDVNLEMWEKKCRESNNLKVIDDWKEYVCNWKSNVGDLYLIPPGTDHGHGGNQMVLEMDTCPSIAGTEYSFFSYDFARNSWDDNTKTMTGKPLKMHLDHSFNATKWRRSKYVEEKLRARAEIIKWTKEYYMDRYTSLEEMPFEIERIHYKTKAQNDTLGRFCHLITLTVGTKARIISKTDQNKYTDINLFQAAVIPASFGAYEIIGEGGGQSTAVILRWKK